MNEYPPDPLIDELRREAADIDPAPPARLRRRIFESLAATHRPAGSPLIHRLRWLLAGACAALLIGGAVLILRQHLGPAPSPVSPAPIANRASAANLFASADLPALAEKFVEDPLEKELETLWHRITQAQKTIMSPLPASKKGA